MHSLAYSELNFHIEYREFLINHRHQLAYLQQFASANHQNFFHTLPMQQSILQPMPQAMPPAMSRPILRPMPQPMFCHPLEKSYNDVRQRANTTVYAKNHFAPVRHPVQQHQQQPQGAQQQQNVYQSNQRRHSVHGPRPVLNHHQHQLQQHEPQEQSANNNRWSFMDMRGHKAPVVDIAMSSNGQYLASSAEADFSDHNLRRSGYNGAEYPSHRQQQQQHQQQQQQHQQQQHHHQQQQQQQEHQQLQPHHSNPASNTTPSRRQQRKQLHMRRSNNNTKTSVPAANARTAAASRSNIVTPATALSAAASRNLALAAPPLKEFAKLGWPIDKLASRLRSDYLLRASEHAKWGYPTLDAQHGGVMVHSDHWSEGGKLDQQPSPAAASSSSSTTTNSSSGCSSSGSSAPSTPKMPASHSTKFDVNAQPFVPGRFHINKDDGLQKEQLQQQRRHSSDDSGLGSGGSNASNSSSDSESESCSSSVDTGTKAAAKFAARNVAVAATQCGRCHQLFSTADTGSVNCRWHLGKLIRQGQDMRFSCCHAGPDSLGCEYATVHVWSGLRPGLNGPYTGFQRTQERHASDGAYHVILALDAEMVYTRHGLELAKVSVCGPDGRMVYEKLVRPEAPVIDYNTRFSGITAPMLQGRAVRTQQQVQQDLLRLIDARTILVGHALNNDLRCLRILHATVVDTAEVFPHHRGAPYRLSLKTLVKTQLQRETQNADDGHDSFEDARNALALLLWHVRRNHSVP